MKNTAKQKIIVIVGPTASGKSDLAVLLAQKFNGEVVSADSRQVYKGLDIGTGKITRREMRGIPHHLLDVASPKRTYTASHFARDGRRAIKKSACGGAYQSWSAEPVFISARLWTIFQFRKYLRT